VKDWGEGHPPAFSLVYTAHANSEKAGKKRLRLQYDKVNAKRLYNSLYGGRRVLGSD
jgi:hypothetical protein